MTLRSPSDKGGEMLGADTCSWTLFVPLSRGTRPVVWDAGGWLNLYRV